MAKAIHRPEITTHYEAGQVSSETLDGELKWGVIANNGAIGVVLRNRLTEEQARSRAQMLNNVNRICDEAIDGKQLSLRLPPMAMAEPEVKRKRRAA